jgi:hypothetical protein
MALYHFSNVVTKDLLFYYDAFNTGKSWKGSPTTNILEGNLSAFSDIVGNSTRTVISPNEVRWVNNGAGVTVVRLYVPLASLNNAQTYGVSVYVKDLVGTATLDWCDVAVTGTPSLTNTSGRLQGTASRSVYDGTYRFLDVTLTQGGMMTLYDPQIDSNNYVTPYVAPTTSRTTSQVLLDLTNLNTITANSLTYATNNTFSFNGSGNNLSIGSFSGYSTGVTCEAWFKTTSGATWKNIISGPTNDIIFTVNGGLLNFGCQGNAPIPHANYSTTTVNTGAWFHGVATFDGSNVRIYINGNLESTNARTGNITVGAKNIGSNSGGSSEYFNGTIDNVKMYSRALSAIEVAQNFNAMRGRYGL